MKIKTVVTIHVVGILRDIVFLRNLTQLMDYTPARHWFDGYLAVVLISDLTAQFYSFKDIMVARKETRRLETWQGRLKGAKFGRKVASNAPSKFL